MIKSLGDHAFERIFKTVDDVAFFIDQVENFQKFCWLKEWEPSVTIQVDDYGTVIPLVDEVPFQLAQTFDMPDTFISKKYLHPRP